MFIEKKKIGITPFKIFLSTCGIFYVWFLPILSEIGFAEPNSTSISEFIANNMEVYAGESSCPLKICPNILQRNLETLTDKGVVVLVN